MKPPAWLYGSTESEDPREFSLVLGGPVYQLLRRAHLADEVGAVVLRRIALFVMLTWLPLLLLSVLEGHLMSSDTAVPFLSDFEAHVRFLVALPLLVVAELVVHQRMRPIVRQFVERRLVTDDGAARFDNALVAALRLRNSVAAEALLIAFVYGVGVMIIWRQFITLDTTTWYASQSAEGWMLSWAGRWYGYVSLPVFQFMLVRWYFRLFIWARFLFQVSRIDLRLIATHPDRTAGLGFLAGTALALGPLVLAHGVLLAGTLSSRVLYLHTVLTAYKFEIGAMVLLMLCIVFGPLLVFVPQLSRVKRQANLEYGALAQRYVQEFDGKWLRGGAPPDEALMGSADIQSLADLANGYQVVQGMNIAPITRDAIVRLVVTTLAPIVPLLLTMMPLDQLLKTLAGILL